MAEPTPSDLARQIEDLQRGYAQRFEELRGDFRDGVKQLREDLQRLDYVGREAYEANHKRVWDELAHQQRAHTELKARFDRKEDEADRFRRNVYAGAILAAIPMVTYLIQLMGSAGGGQ